MTSEPVPVTTFMEDTDNGEIKVKVFRELHSPCLGCDIHKYRIDHLIEEGRTECQFDCPDCGTTTKFMFNHDTQVVSAKIVDSEYQKGYALLAYKDPAVPILLIVDTMLGKSDLEKRARPLSAYERVVAFRTMREEMEMNNESIPALEMDQTFLSSVTFSNSIRDLHYPFDIAEMNDTDLSVWLDNYLDDHKFPVGYVMPYRLTNKDFTYRSHVCPVNYLGVKGFSVEGDRDPHGSFLLKSFITHKQLMKIVAKDHPSIDIFDGNNQNTLFSILESLA